MSDIAFSELEYQVELLPMAQIAKLKEKIDSIIALRTRTEPFEFDRLVCKSERADFADSYIRELRDNDRL